MLQLGTNIQAGGDGVASEEAASGSGDISKASFRAILPQCATKRKSTGEEWALAHGLEGLPREHHLRAPPPAGQVVEGECPCPVPNEGRGEQSCG